jgi:putative nucleotidyltransferase with HDIG domain
MAARQLTSLAALPQTLSKLLGILKSSGLTPQVAEIIKSDPSLTALVLSLESTSGANLTIDDKLASLSASEIQSLILSAPAHCQETDSLSHLSYRQILIHSVATACAAGLIADIALDHSQRQLAYTAGLLHDIGKLALDRIMPRSFQRIAESAHLNHQPFHIAEFAHLDIDHTIIGKRLAEKWHLPQAVMYAIWLHHTDTESMIHDSSDYRFVRVIKLADILARQISDAPSGSFAPAVIPDGLLHSLGISEDDVKSLLEPLAQAIAQKTELLGINDQDAAAQLPEILQETASLLAGKNAFLYKKNHDLVAFSLQIDFVNQLFTEIDTLSIPIDVAQSCVELWQRHYKCGAVCLYFISDTNDMTMEMVAIDSNGKISTSLPSIKGDNPAIPVQIQNDFGLIDARDTSNWILNQIDLDFDISKTKMVPLLHCQRAIGALVFEQGADQPLEKQQIANYETPASAIAVNLAQSIALQKNSHLAERFVTALGSANCSNDRVIKQKTFAGIAEMAAGAGHELNNPLAIISGKTQMLAASEQDPDKKKTLAQIEAKAQEASRMVSQMMTYAKPGVPNAAPFSLVKIINAAAELVAVAHRLDALDISMQGMDAATMVNVDPDQMAPALTAILSNCLDAYEQGTGPIEITANCPQKPGFTSFLIRDNGVGMDAETVAKATIPFFSAKPAGRKRGMGLANAQRLIELNSGSIKITSIPEKGTTVRLELPI